MGLNVAFDRANRKSRPLTPASTAWLITLGSRNAFFRSASTRLANDRHQPRRERVQRAVGCMRCSASDRSTGSAFCQECSDGRHELDWDFHHGRRRRSVRRFVLSHCFDVRLRFVVIEHPLHAGLVPTWWESTPFLHGFFRCDDFWRRRRAFRALSPRSYAVITNTEPGVGSGT